MPCTGQQTEQGNLLDWEEEEAREMKKEHPVKIKKDWEDFAKSGPWRFDLPPDDLTKDIQRIQHVVIWISGHQQQESGIQLRADQE